jgi:hypothetical protein
MLGPVKIDVLARLHLFSFVWRYQGAILTSSDTTASPGLKVLPSIVISLAQMRRFRWPLVKR